MSEAASLALFQDRFGLDDRCLARTLETALERKIDSAELFFEYTTQDSVALEEGIVKSGSRHIEQGVGVRAQAGERQGYAHSDEVTVESLEIAATTARSISRESQTGGSVAVRSGAPPARDLYPVERAPTDEPIETKVALLEEIDAYARACDPRVKQVMASCVSEHRNVLIVGSDGRFASDVRPLIRLNVQVIVQAAEGHREVGYQGMGGRRDFASLLAPDAWRPLVDEAVRVATLNPVSYTHLTLPTTPYV